MAELSNSDLMDKIIGAIHDTDCWPDNRACIPGVPISMAMRRWLCECRMYRLWGGTEVVTFGSPLSQRQSETH